MKISIIGAGNVGTGIAKQLTPKGHVFFFSFSKDPEKLTNTAKLFGAQSGNVAEACAFADIIILATPWTATSDALKQIGASAKDKIVWDCTNALKPDMSGLEIGTTTSGGEEVQKALTGAKVVKAIPPFAEVMHNNAMLDFNGHHPCVIACSNDAAAKTQVMALVRELGATAIDGGPLSNARYTEPAGYLLVQLAYMLGNGTNIGMEIFGLKSNADQKAA